MLVFVDTAHTDKNGSTQFWVENLPKNKTWYSYDNTAAPILYSVYFDNPERDLVIDKQYGDFQYEDGSSFSSDSELITYLRNILGTSINGSIDSGNSSSTPLGIDGVFTGTAIDVTDYSNIYVTVKSNVASATDGLSIQQSHDGTNWDHTDEFTISANSGKTFSFQAGAKWFRVVYTNSGTGQTFFRLQTMFKKSGGVESSHRIQDSIVDDDDAALVKAVLTGKANGSFVNVLTTQDGNITVSDNSDGLAIAKGDVTGHTFVHKFGSAGDFDTGDNEVTVWDGANDGLLGGGAMAYTYSSTDDIGLLSSSSGSDTVDIEIQGVLSDGTLSTQTFTLNGQTDVDLSATGTDFKRVFRMKNIGAANLVGTVYVRTNGSAQSGGVPSTANTVRSIIQIGNNQTLMSIYTVPTGKTGYLRSFFASEGGASRDTNYIIRLKARPSGGVFQLKHKTALSSTGTSHFQHPYVEPEVFAAGTDIEMTAQVTSGAITAADISTGFDIVLVDV
jgi:hypothetical protein